MYHVIPAGVFQPATLAPVHQADDFSTCRVAASQAVAIPFTEPRQPQQSQYPRNRAAEAEPATV
jgi:hypothetical protein